MESFSSSPAKRQKISPQVRSISKLSSQTVSRTPTGSSLFSAAVRKDSFNEFGSSAEDEAIVFGRRKALRRSPTGSALTNPQPGEAAAVVSDYGVGVEDEALAFGRRGAIRRSPTTGGDFTPIRPSHSRQNSDAGDSATPPNAVPGGGTGDPSTPLAAAPPGGNISTPLTAVPPGALILGSHRKGALRRSPVILPPESPFYALYGSPARRNPSENGSQFLNDSSGDSLFGGSKSNSAQFSFAASPGSRTDQLRKTRRPRLSQSPTRRIDFSNVSGVLPSSGSSNGSLSVDGRDSGGNSDATKDEPSQGEKSATIEESRDSSREDANATMEESRESPREDTHTIMDDSRDFSQELPNTMGDENIEFPGEEGETREFSSESNEPSHSGESSTPPQTGGSNGESGGAPLTKPMRKPQKNTFRISPKLSRKRKSNSVQETEEEAANRKEIEKTRKILEAQIKALNGEVQDLQVEIEQERLRIQNEKQKVEHAKSSGMEDMIQRLLSANDNSHTSLPTPTAIYTSTKADPAIPSTLPLDVEDPLPQLKAFSPLTFTSSTTTILPSSPSSSPSETARQRHDISGYAGERLLFFKISMEVTLSTLTVDTLSWEVSNWSKRELEPCLRQAQEEQDINTTLYAIGSYLTLSKTRAVTFAKLCRKYPDLLPAFASKSSSSSSKKKPATKDTTDDEEEEEEEEESPPSRREITPHLGSSILRFRSRAKKPKPAAPSYSSFTKRTESSSGELELVFSWGISPDPTGEAESVLSANVRLPSYCTELDETRSFEKIGQMFDVLVVERGVFEAVGCVVGLLFHHQT